MTRRLLNLVTVMSLLLCVAVAGLWVLSGFRAVSLGHGGGPNAGGFTPEWQVGCRQGRVCWMLAWHWATSSPEDVGFYFKSGPPRPVAFPWLLIWTQNGYGAGGFYVERMRAPAVRWDRRFVAAPNWFLIAMFLVLPVMRWLKRKPAPGRCARCGYDLRATPDRCPECGATP